MIPIGDAFKRISQAWQQSAPGSQAPIIGIPSGDLTTGKWPQDELRKQKTTTHQKNTLDSENILDYPQVDIMKIKSTDERSCQQDLKARSHSPGSSTEVPEPSSSAKIENTTVNFKDLDSTLLQQNLPAEEEGIISQLSTPQISFLDVKGYGSLEGIAQSKNTKCPSKSTRCDNRPVRASGREFAQRQSQINPEKHKVREHSLEMKTVLIIRSKPKILQDPSIMVL